MSKPKRVYFKTHALLKDLVGKDLINDDNIAIVEIIKNSYDAGSPGVDLVFSNFDDSGRTTSESTILIADSGCGMGENDIKTKWLNIAYSEKRNTPQEHGSYLAGNKGVGRFSCDRLGETLDMFTRKSNGDILHLDVNWPDFEKEGDQDLTIQKIPVKLNATTNDAVRKLTGRKLSKSGTILFIRNLRSVWDRNNLLDLKSHLEKFINPNQLFQKQSFKINLKAKHFIEEDKKTNITKKLMELSKT